MGIRETRNDSAKRVLTRSPVVCDELRRGEILIHDHIIMKAPTDPRQLQLWSDYKNAKRDFDVAADRLSKAVMALTKAKTQIPKEVMKAEAKEVDKTTSDLRKRFRKMVNVLARRKKIEWRWIYRSIWDKIREACGYDPEVEGILHNEKPIAMLERKGHLPLALQLAAGMA